MRLYSLLAGALACALVLCPLVTSAQESSVITLTKLPAPDLPADILTLPWSDGSDAWKAGHPLFSVADPTTGLKGTGWIAVSRAALLLRLEAADAHHVAPDKQSPWAGDGVELCIDARGDRTRGLPREAEEAQGPDDVKLVIALAQDGPYLNRQVASDPAKRGPMPLEYVDIARDDERGLTTYDLRLPWSLFETEPGLFPTMGIAVQFNDLNPGMQEKNVLKWGAGTYGPFRAGLFNIVAMPTPGDAFAALAIGDMILWEPDEVADLTVATKSDKDLQLIAAFDDETVTRPLPAGGLTRYTLALAPREGEQLSIPFTVTVVEPERKLTMAEASSAVEYPERVYAAVIDRLSELILTAEPPLLKRHLQSVKALTASEWSRMMFYRHERPHAALETYAFVKDILAGLGQDAADWESYRNGTRNLVMGYVSPHDRSIQYYQLGLPKNWDPEKTYPLFFELHGAGNQNPLSGIARCAGPINDETNQFGVPGFHTYASVQGHGYHVMPFGRGNLGYRGIAEIDVWEAYDDAHNIFKIDPDRQYLYGFSMGGGGTWSIGTRTPDRWASMAILAGGMWRESRDTGIGRNIAHMPVFMWCGTSDSLYPNLAAMKEEVERYGGTPVVRETEGLGHNYRGDIQVMAIDWLQQFTREVPQKFSFVADTAEHRGAYGITMERKLSVSGLPHFTCTIENNVVTIDSEGTPGLTVNAGEGGLGLKGDIKIVWNGAEAYAGEAKTVQLGEVGPPRRRRR